MRRRRNNPYSLLIVFLFFTIIALLPVLCRAECTMSVDSNSVLSNEYTENGIVKSATIPIHFSCTGAGEAITDELIDIPVRYRGMQLREVEIMPGTSTSSILIENEHDPDGELVTNVVGAPIWYLSAIVTTADATLSTYTRIYGGHTKWGIFPTFDCKWYLTASELQADDDFYIYLKLRSGD